MKNTAKMGFNRRSERSGYNAQESADLRIAKFGKEKAVVYTKMMIQMFNSRGSKLTSSMLEGLQQERDTLAALEAK